MATTPHLGLTLIEQSQAQKEVTMNMALMRLDALINTGVADKDLATPPVSPVTGDVYLVADSATGEWAGHEGEIAYFEQIWRFIVPNAGLMLWVADEGAFYLFDGSGWGPTSGGASLSGMSDVVLDSPAHGEVLVFDSVAGGWVNGTIAGGGGGETNTGANVSGDSGGVYKDKSGTALRFNNIVAGANITVSGGGASGGDVTIIGGAGGGGGEANTASNVSGSSGGVFKGKSSVDLQFNNIVAGDNITISGGGASGGDITIVGGAGASSPALTDVSDVTISGVSSGELLAYSGSEWVNYTLAEAGVAAQSHTHSLSDITDAGSLAAQSNINNADWAGADLSVANGGTGLSAVSTDCLMVGNGTSALNVTGVKVDSSDCLYGFKGKLQVQTGTTYTLVAGDTGCIVECNNASAITLTLPNGLSQGFTCTVVQKGAGVVTMSAASGAALHNRQGHSKTAGQYAACTLYVTSNSGGSSAVYVLAGDTQS